MQTDVVLVRTKFCVMMPLSGAGEVPSTERPIDLQ